MIFCMCVNYVFHGFAWVHLGNTFYKKRDYRGIFQWLMCWTNSACSSISYLWITSCQMNVCIVQSQKEKNIFFQTISLGDEAKIRLIQQAHCKKWKFYSGCICLCLCLCVCVMAQHIHTLYYDRCTCVISMLLGLCFHASVALIESNHGAGAPLWHELVHDIVESVLAGSIDVCFQGHRGVVTGLRALSLRLDSWLGNTWPSQCRSLPGSPWCWSGLQINMWSNLSSWVSSV